MPMRCLGYVSRTLENLASAKGLYGSQPVELPATEFYTFFAGTADWEVKVLRLSDCFLAEPKENSLELVVNVINLNYQKDDSISKKSPSLLGYSKLIHYTRSYASESKGDLKYAIDEAVKQCINEGLISDFLVKHSREVSGMLFKEITSEEFAEIRAKEGEKIGAEKKQREIAKEMRAEGIDLPTIARITKLSVDEIETL